VGGKGQEDWAGGGWVGEASLHTFFCHVPFSRAPGESLGVGQLIQEDLVLLPIPPYLPEVRTLSSEGWEVIHVQLLE
jgi:hypothetical protein